MHIPANLPPGPLADLIDLTVLRVESLPQFHRETVIHGNQAYSASAWRETIRSGEEVLAHFEGAYRDGAPAMVGNAKARYLATVPETALVNLLIAEALDWAGVAPAPGSARRSAFRLQFRRRGRAIARRRDQNLSGGLGHGAPGRRHHLDVRGRGKNVSRSD
jgi:beta-galactosidase GanA